MGRGQAGCEIRLVGVHWVARLPGPLSAAQGWKFAAAARGAAGRAPTAAVACPGGLPALCLVVARLRAPRPRPYRIYVFHVAWRWSLVLADAVCWGLVEGLRSVPPARGGTLGSFRGNVVYVPMPAVPWADSADLRLVFHPVPRHHRPWWLANAALSVARAAARLAGWTLCVAAWPFPEARTFAMDWTAVSPTRSAPTTCALAAHAVGTWRRRSTAAAAVRFGRIHPMPLDAAPRLSARGATRAAWRPASAEASSQTGEE